MQWKFQLLPLPSVKSSILLPSVQASICFPFMEDRRAACKFGEVGGSTWKSEEEVLARRSLWDEVDVS